MSNETYTLTYCDSSEEYATYTLARAAQVELNALGMIGSSIDKTERSERSLIEVAREELTAAGIDLSILAYVPEGQMCTRGELVRAGELTAAEIIAGEDRP